jgi:hypothetical protein
MLGSEDVADTVKSVMEDHDEDLRKVRQRVMNYAENDAAVTAAVADYQRRQQLEPIASKDPVLSSVVGQNVLANHGVPLAVASRGLRN